MIATGKFMIAVRKERSAHALTFFLLLAKSSGNTIIEVAKHFFGYDSYGKIINHT